MSVYITDRNPVCRLWGGLWTMHRQDGFPLASSVDHLSSLGDKVDWIEAFADASQYNEGPQLLAQAQELLSDEDLIAVKARVSALISHFGDDWASRVLAMKKAVS